MSKRQRAEKYSKIAKRQAGAFSLEQARAVGLTKRYLHQLVRTTVLRSLGRGVYCVNGTPETFELSVWAACLEANGFASHRTAGRLWGLDGLSDAPEPVEVVVPFDNRRKAGFAQVHRSRTLGIDHVYTHRGPPRTNIARTLVDLNEVLGEDEFELAFDSALRRVRVLRPWLKTMLQVMPTCGHRNIGRLLGLVDSEAPALDSAFEVKLRQILRRSDLPPPTSQYRVRSCGRVIARLDFAWLHLGRPVALLAHGFRWHGKRKRWKYDLWQVSELNKLNWCVIQCTSDVLTNPAELKELLDTLRTVTAPAPLADCA